MPLEYRSWAEISTQQICANYRAICAAAGPAVDVAAVVKSDAYGHGAIEVSRALEAAGARWFAVSTAEE
ncbi:MAG TPA: alanine racemase, partial [Bryobacteraceae bacterium]|nr:alanine racemase [Bryobacteraceae bacterium]